MDRSPRCGCVIVMRRITCSRYVTCLPGWPEQPRDLCTNCHTRSGLITLGGERLREKLRSVKHFIIISDGSFQNDTTCNITLVCVICSRHTHAAWEPVATFRPLSPSPQHPSTRIHTGGSLLQIHLMMNTSFTTFISNMYRYVIREQSESHSNLICAQS